MNPKRTHKNIWLLGIASLLNDVSSEIIAPILPLIIKNIGGNGISIGLIGGIRDGLTHLLKLAFGMLSDHKNTRKPFIFTGYLISALFKGALILAQTWQHILLFVGLDRLGKSIRTSPRDVIVAQSTPHCVGTSLGIIRSFDNIGATIGSAIVFLLLWLYKLDLNVIVFLATSIALLALIPLAFVTEPTHDNASEKFPFSKTTPTTVKYFALINSIFHFGSINYMFLTLRVHDCTTIFSPVQNALLMYISFNLMHALCAAPFGKIIDVLKPRSCVIVGYILYGLVMGGFWYAQTPMEFWILFILYGATLALTDTSQRAFAIELAPARRQGTSIGMVYASMGIAQITGGIASGYIWEHMAHEHIFVISMCTAAISTLWLLLYKPTP
ncbi:MFS transporter, partial [Candidatus Dependentiae bacterium]|nr:MFS transporter [Candidatus Dependentiae bacterium]